MLEIFNSIFKLFLNLISFTDVVDVFSSVLILLLDFTCTILFLLLNMEILFELHLSFGIHLLVFTVVQMIIVKMLNLLHVGDDLSAVLCLFSLHKGIQV